MAFIPAPNAAQVDMIFTQEGQTIENVYHVLGTSPYSSGSLALLAGAFKNWWDVQIKPTAPTNLSLVKVDAKALDSKTAPAIEYIDGLPLSGTASSASPEPLNVTAAITWVTGLRGRSYRGRTYHVGLTKTLTEHSSLASGIAASLQTKYNALIAAIDLVSGQLCVCSKYEDKSARTVCELTAILNAVVDSTLDSQRRRLPGRGR